MKDRINARSVAIDGTDDPFLRRIAEGAMLMLKGWRQLDFNHAETEEEKRICEESIENANKALDAIGEMTGNELADELMRYNYEVLATVHAYLSMTSLRLKRKGR